MDQRHVVIVAEHGEDFFGLALTQQAVINKHTGQLIANRLVDQNGRDRTVDPP